MRRLVLAVSTALLMMMAAAPAWAHHDDDPKFVIHLKTPASKPALICTGESPNDTTGGAAIPCSQYVTAWPVCLDADLYIVIAQVRPDTFDTEPANIAGASFGITYDDVLNSGMDIVGLPTYCADGLIVPSGTSVFPEESGSSVRITWLTCQTQVIGNDGIHAIAMVFSVFAHGLDTFSIIPNRNLTSGDELNVANCSSQEFKLDTVDYGRIAATADFGVGVGCNPCVVGCIVPVAPATWGKIKNMYDR